jgi:hypothetical protein
MAMPIPAMIPVPIFELEARRKKLSIGFPVRVEDGAALGVRVACIKHWR